MDTFVRSFKRWKKPTCHLVAYDLNKLKTECQAQMLKTKYILHFGPSVILSSLLSPQSFALSQVHAFGIHLLPFLHANSESEHFFAK